MGVKQRIEAWLGTYEGRRYARIYRWCAVVMAGVVITFSTSAATRVPMLVLLVVLVLVIGEEAGWERKYTAHAPPWPPPSKITLLQRARQAAELNKVLIEVIGSLVASTAVLLSAVVWIITRLF